MLGDPVGTAFVGGRALAHFGTFQTFDVLFVVDQSASTAKPSGVDLDGDGRVDDRTCSPGIPRLIDFFVSLVGTCRSGKDSVLATELAAVRVLLGQFDPRTTRAGLVSFSGARSRIRPDGCSDCARVEHLVSAGRCAGEG
jgi:hypothetical protein